eukprot:scaffold228950_cov35-Tisochrysis_lutea.AAC.1
MVSRCPRPERCRAHQQLERPRRHGSYVRECTISRSLDKARRLKEGNVNHFAVHHSESAFRAVDRPRAMRSAAHHGVVELGEVEGQGRGAVESDEREPFV